MQILEDFHLRRFYSFQKGSAVVGRSYSSRCSSSDLETANILRASSPYFRMDQLEVGDKILSVDPRTGAARFEDVYLFGHRDGQVSAEYIRLGMNCQAEAGDMFQKSLELTPGHFLPVSDDSAAWEDRYMISAERARVGMTLWTAAKPGEKPHLLGCVSVLGSAVK